MFTKDKFVQSSFQQILGRPLSIHMGLLDNPCHPEKSSMNWLVNHSTQLAGDMFPMNWLVQSQFVHQIQMP